MSFPIDYSDRKPLGNTGVKVSAIGIGTWAIRDPVRAVDALAYAVSLGLDMIDTAEMYANGDAEKIVGEVVRQVGRDSVFITTKLLPERFINREYAVKAIRASLQRLGVKRVDLLLIHWPHPMVPIRKQVEILESLVIDGYAEYIGVSNFDKDELALALESTKKYEIVVDQVKYSVLDKSIEKNLLPFAIKNKVTIQAYTPLERGRVADNPVVRKIAEKYGKTPVQVALNYLISRPMVTAIPKTERRERVKEFHGALGWRLDQHDILFLEKNT